MSRKRRKKKHAGQQADTHAAAAAAFDSKIRTAFQGVENFVIQRAADIEPKPIQWLWPNRIARGQLTLLAGDSGAGKSLLALDMAARVSSGAAWPDRPDERQTPGNVLVLTAHDDPASIGRPRLERAGADLSRVFFVSGVDRQENGKSTWKRQVNLPDDLMSLTKVIMAFRPIKLVVIDAAWVFCSRGNGARSKRAGPARLAELAELAAMLQVAIVCVTDLRRDGHGEAVYRAAGDRALLAAAPMAWGLVRDPCQPARRLMLPLKSNCGPEQPALAFDIDDGRIVWDSQAPAISAPEVLAAEKAKRDSSGADGWLKEFLADGPQPANEVYRQGKECGYSPRLLQRIRPLLGAETEKVGFNDDSYWEWSLGDTQQGHGMKVASPSAEVAAAATEFENSCGEKGEGGDERGERTRLAPLGNIGGATELEGGIGTCERPPLPPLTKGGSEARAAHVEARIFEDRVSSSRNLGGFYEDARIAEAASSRDAHGIFEAWPGNREGEAPAEPPLCVQQQ